MSPFDGTRANQAWATPRGLKVFGGPGASGERLAAESAHFLRSYEARNVNHPTQGPWLKKKLDAYNAELINVCGSDMNAIYAEYAGANEQAIRREMESIGYTKEVLERWGMLDGEEDLIDDFEPHFM